MNTTHEHYEIFNRISFDVSGFVQLEALSPEYGQNTTLAKSIAAKHLSHLS